MARACDALRQAESLSAELITTLAKLARTGPGSEGRKTDDHPLPINLAALEAGQGLLAVLSYWVGVVGISIGRRNGKTQTHWMASALLVYSERIRQRDDAHQFVREITQAVRAVERVVDVPPGRWYAGPCEVCSRDLYAGQDQTRVRCACGASYDVRDRRDWLLSQVQDRLATPIEISRALGTLAGVEVTPSVIRGLAHRGRITQHERGRYRVGDVLDRILERQRGKVRVT